MKPGSIKLFQQLAWWYVGVALVSTIALTILSDALSRSPSFGRIAFAIILPLALAGTLGGLAALIARRNALARWLYVGVAVLALAYNIMRLMGPQQTGERIAGIVVNVVGDSLLIGSVIALLLSSAAAWFAAGHQGHGGYSGVGGPAGLNGHPQQGGYPPPPGTGVYPPHSGYPPQQGGYPPSGA